jgi:hypothetical protein
VSKRSKRDQPPLADVEIGAAVHAKRLRFNRKPETKVEFEPAGESDSHTERENLPEEVEPGVTYRDVHVRWRGGAQILVQAPDAPNPDSEDSEPVEGTAREAGSDRRRKKKNKKS